MRAEIAQHDKGVMVMTASQKFKDLEKGQQDMRRHDMDKSREKLEKLLQKLTEEEGRITRGFKQMDVDANRKVALPCRGVVEADLLR